LQVFDGGGVCFEFFNFELHVLSGQVIILSRVRVLKLVNNDSGAYNLSAVMFLASLHGVCDVADD